MEISKINVVDTRLVNSNPQIEMIRGPASMSKNIASISGNVNTQSWQFNIPINTEGTAVDLRVYAHVVASFDIVLANKSGGTITIGDSPVSILQAGGNISLGPLPLNSLFSAGTSVNFNEKQIMTYDPSNFGDMVYRMYDVKKLNEELTCPSYPELSFAQYTDAYLTTANPCGSYADSSPFAGVNNGSFAITFGANNTLADSATWANNATQTVTATVEFWEPLNIAPFELGQKSVNCPYYIRNMLINLVIGSCNRVFRFGTSAVQNMSIVPSGGSGLVVQSVNFSSLASPAITTCELHYMTLTPPLLSGFSLPEQSIIHTHNILTNSIVGSAFSASIKSQQITLSNQNSNGCPRFMILACKRQNTAYDFTSASWYYPITNLVISEGNNQNLLASLNQVDLYNINRRNGSKQDWVSFTGTANSVSFGVDGTANAVAPVQACSGPVILELGKDISLPFNVVNGSSGNFVFNITATCQNSELVGGVAKYNTPTLYVAFIYDSYFTTDGKTKLSDLKQSFLTSAEVMGDAPNKEESEVVKDPNELTGGALHKMNNSKGRPHNLSSRSALSRRIVY